MKHQVSRLFAILLSLLAVFSVITPVAFCEDDGAKTIQLDLSDLWSGSLGGDGYDVISPVEKLHESSAEHSSNGVDSVCRSCAHYNNDGNLAWVVTLWADFYHDGNIAECTSSSLTVSVFSAGSG